MATRSEGVPDNDISRYKTAFRYYSYSCDQGNGNSQRIMGDFYYYLRPPVNETVQINKTVNVFFLSFSLLSFFQK